MTGPRPADAPSPAPPAGAVIATAASEPFATSLLALLGSLRANWPGHPPVVVFDLGPGDRSRRTVARHAGRVVPAPPFRPHRRKHPSGRGWRPGNRGRRSPREAPGQAVWVHRRRMRPPDAEAFVRALLVPDPAPHAPGAPPEHVMTGRPARPDSPLLRARKRVAAWRGRTPRPPTPTGVSAGGGPELPTDLLREVGAA